MKIFGWGLCTVLALAGGSGCDSREAAAPATNAAPVATSVDPAANPPKGMKRCYQCNGTTRTRCAAPGCFGGTIDCPNPCLKRNQGVWEPLPNYPGELFRVFRYRNGYQAFSTKHVGEVVKFQNGVPTPGGTCPVCNGTTRVKCPRCGGTGLAKCTICQGKGIIPADWSPLDNPRIPPSGRLSDIRFKDGHTVKGRIKMRSGSTVLIETESGMVRVDSSELEE